MEIITKQDIVAALRQVGAGEGQVIYLQSDLRTPGFVKGVRDQNEFCQVYLDAIQEVIGPDGTLVLPTYTTQVARYDMDFEWEKTPSVVGLFSEFVRTKTNSLRSIHPLSSLTALGARQEEICKNNGLSDFGWESPFHRMLNSGAKIMSVGLEAGYAVGIAHHVEAACCVPYVYNKRLKWKPIVAGKRVESYYTATVRYLNLGVLYHMGKYAAQVRATGGIRKAKLGSSWVYMTDYEQVFNEGVAALMKDESFFLASDPKYVYGTIPFDGPTAGKDGIAKDAQDSSIVNWAGYYLGDRYSLGGDE